MEDSGSKRTSLLDLPGRMNPFWLLQLIFILKLQIKMFRATIASACISASVVHGKSAYHVLNGALLNKSSCTVKGILERQKAKLLSRCCCCRRYRSEKYDWKLYGSLCLFIHLLKKLIFHLQGNDLILVIDYGRWTVGGTNESF